MDYPFLETRSGVAYTPTRPSSSQVVLSDLAYSLSRLARYNGHTHRRVYYVGEHCCHLADWVERQPWSRPSDAWLALHHEDSEPYLGDLIRPVKELCPDFKVLEDKCDLAAALSFKGMPTERPAWLKTIDSRIIHDERLHFMAPSENRWFTDDLEPLGVRFWGVLGGFQWYVRRQWLKRHRRLGRLVNEEGDNWPWPRPLVY